MYSNHSRPAAMLHMHARLGGRADARTHSAFVLLFLQLEVLLQACILVLQCLQPKVRILQPLLALLALYCTLRFQTFHLLQQMLAVRSRRPASAPPMQLQQRMHPKQLRAHCVQRV